MKNFVRLMNYLEFKIKLKWNLMKKNIIINKLLKIKKTKSIKLLKKKVI
jgi:hypothetical protein